MKWISGTTSASPVEPQTSRGKVLTRSLPLLRAKPTADAIALGAIRTSASVNSSHAASLACPMRSQPHCLPFQPSGNACVGTRTNPPCFNAKRSRMLGVSSVL